MKLETMNSAQLVKLRADVDAALITHAERAATQTATQKLSQLRSDLRAIADRLESEVAKAAPIKSASHANGQPAPTRKRAKRAGGKVPTKYADNAGNAWSGRGKQPRWMRDAVAKGATVEQFRVQAGVARTQRAHAI